MGFGNASYHALGATLHNRTMSGTQREKQGLEPWCSFCRLGHGDASEVLFRFLGSGNGKRSNASLCLDVLRT